MAVPRLKQSTIQRSKAEHTIESNTIAISISMNSESADKSDVNRAKGNSPEANTGYADLSEYTSLEERLREAEEAKTVKKLEESIAPKEAKPKAKKKDKADEAEDSGDDADADDADEDTSEDDDAFASGDDEDE